MGEVTMEHAEGSSCTTCQKAAAVSRENEEVSMAFLLALMPVIVLTFFGQVNLL